MLEAEVVSAHENTHLFEYCNFLWVRSEILRRIPYPACYSTVKNLRCIGNLGNLLSISSLSTDALNRVRVYQCN